MKIDLSKYYDLDEVESWVDASEQTMYTVYLISKSTGEIIDWTFTEELFEELLKEMREEVIEKFMQIYRIPSIPFMRTDNEQKILDTFIMEFDLSYE